MCFFFVPTEFEKEEVKRMEKEMAQFAHQLEKETLQEKEKHERNLEALNKRKEDLIKERKSKMKVGVCLGHFCKIIHFCRFEFSCFFEKLCWHFFGALQ